MKPLSLLMLGACSLSSTLVGCAGEVSFDSPESAARLRAIQRAAAEDDRSSIPKLIEMLDSDDSAVRLLAILTLESMTGQTLGYDATAPSYERASAVDRWQLWYEDQNGGSAKGAKSAQSPNKPDQSTGPSPTSDPNRAENRSTGSTPTPAHTPGSPGQPGGDAGAME